MTPTPQPEATPAYQDRSVYVGDALDIMRSWPADWVDLVFFSPPYEDARLYGIDFKLKGQEWVDWMVPFVLESLRVCRGLVAFVVEGRTRKFKWSATPMLLMADLHRAGVCLRKPPAFHRVGIPGSGGPDWLRNDWEFIVCATNGGKLPWSDNTAMGHDPKYPPGGPPSHRTTATRGSKGGDARVQNAVYVPPKKANPGNVIQQTYTASEVAALLGQAGNVIHCKVGGGLMGDPLAHETEAPFPESLAEFFIRSFCPPDGIVLDPFIGSGTTLAVAKKTGRRGIGIDVRESQRVLTEKRLSLITPGAE